MMLTPIFIPIITSGGGEPMPFSVLVAVLVGGTLFMSFIFGVMDGQLDVRFPYTAQSEWPTTKMSLLFPLYGLGLIVGRFLGRPWK